MQRKHRIALVATLMLVMITSFMAGRQFQILADSTSASPDLLQAVRAIRVAGIMTAPTSDAREEMDLKPLEAFAQVLENITRSYVTPIEDRQKLTHGAIRGMLAALEDPYTRFMEPHEYQAFQQENQGHFEGIGATIGLTEVKVEGEAANAVPWLRCPSCGSQVKAQSYRVTIIAPLPGSPAIKAGVKAGDLILQIDGKPTDGMTLTDVVKLIRGERGTTVKLLLGREGADQPLLKEIVRGPVDVPTVETKLLEDGIGFMRVNYFYEETGRAVAKGLEELRSQQMRALVVDVRNNPGGLLERCLEVVRQFVDTEPVVHVQERGRPMRPFYGFGRREPAHRFDLPLAVLINKGSASASEIFAGAIQDAKVGQLVGAPTFGKGSVQTILPLSDGSAIALTTAKWYTLSKRDIDHQGVTPDVAVEMSPEAALQGPEDVQYQKALELVRRKVAAAVN